MKNKMEENMQLPLSLSPQLNKMDVISFYFSSLVEDLLTI